MRTGAGGAAAVFGAAVLLALVSCAEERPPRAEPAPRPSPGARPDVVIQIPLEPGVTLRRIPVANPYEGDAHALHEGQRLYEWFNCSGCHFGGGGGIGPPLTGIDWIYGGDPDQLFDSIAAGRANGMPAYGGLLTSAQIWQIVLYVQSLHLDPAERGSLAQ